MLINHHGIICHISKIEEPYRIWYHISHLIPEYSDKYIQEKLGVTDPPTIRRLRDEFDTALGTLNSGKPDLLEAHSFRFDKHEWTFYLDDKTENSITLFIERGLSPNIIGQTGRHPRGLAWAVIDKADSPEMICQKLNDDQLAFAKALHKKLKKIMGW